MRTTAGAVRTACFIWLLLAVSGSRSEAAKATRVALNFFVGGTGESRATILISTLLPKPEAVANQLGQALGTGARDVDLDVNLEKHVVACNIRSQKRFEAQRHSVSGQLRFDSLLDTLRQAGATEIEVQFSHPRAKYSRCSLLTNNPAATSGPWVEYFGTVPLNDAASSPIRFEFGYHSADVVRAFAPLLLLAPVPVLFALFRRRTGSAQQSQWVCRLGIPTFLYFVLWSVFVGVFEADLILYFVLGLVEPPGRCLCEVAVGAVPPLGLIGAADALSRRRSAQRASNPLPWFVPAALAALALAAFRNSGAEAAVLWWIAASLAAATIVGQRAWILRTASASPSSSTDDPSTPTSRVRVRSIALKRWWIATIIIVGIPTTGAWLIRRYQVDQPAATVWAGAGFLLTLLLWVCAKAWSFKAWCAGLPAGVPSSTKSVVVWAILTVLVRLGLAWLACSLLDLPVDLEHGDEGLVALSCVLIVAVLAAVSTFRRQ
jgi:hypothetical protein